MIGVILLVVSLITYFTSQKRWFSYFLYLSFMSGSYGGFNLWTSDVIGINVTDIAFIYTFFVLFVLIQQKKVLFPHITFSKYYKYTLVLIVVCLLFSIFYYDLNLMQALRGGRFILLIFSYPILVRIKFGEFEKVLKLVVFIVFLTSILYVGQVMLGRPLMPYSLEYKNDVSTGLIRLYNSPFQLVFFLLLSFIAPQYFKGKISLYRIIFILAVFATQGRTYILTALLAILIIFALSHKMKSNIKYIVIFAIVIIPFSDIIISRFDNDGRTLNDLQKIQRGEVGDNFSTEVGEGATLSYRLAWVYERAAYLARRPLLEQLFGMGWSADSDPITHKRYRFGLGLKSKENGNTAQLSTPDISYGNMITRFGFLGMFVYLVMVVSLTLFFYRNRNFSPLFLVASVTLIVMFIGSISSSAMSNPATFAFYFFIMSTYFNKKAEASINNRLCQK